MAVAIFDHQPGPAELLERRIERGWRPTPTSTRDGDVVLGFASCCSISIPRSGSHP